MDEMAARLLAAYRDPSVVELMLNPNGDVFVERQGGALERLPALAPEPAVREFLGAVLKDGAELGPGRPFADLAASDGSRIHVLAPPVVSKGLCVTIRKRPPRRPALEELVRGGGISPACAAFLKFAAGARRNILVAGGTSSGKTTLLNALAAGLDPKERVVVLEDTQELSLPQPHVLYLKTRLRDAGGGPDVTLRDLVVNALRMRPDRLLVGEVRSVEAAELLQAMNVGQEGTMATLHANSAREALHRLETLVLFAGAGLPLSAVRSYLATAVDLVVFMARTPQGVRRVAQVLELVGMEGETLTTSDIFLFDPRQGPAGELRPTGNVPRFYERLRLEGREPPIEFFRKGG